MRQSDWRIWARQHPNAHGRYVARGQAIRGHKSEMIDAVEICVGDVLHVTGRVVKSLRQYSISRSVLDYVTEGRRVCIRGACQQWNLNSGVFIDGERLIISDRRIMNWAHSYFHNSGVGRGPVSRGHLEDVAVFPFRLWQEDDVRESSHECPTIAGPVDDGVTYIRATQVSGGENYL